MYSAYSPKKEAMGSRPEREKRFFLKKIRGREIRVCVIPFTRGVGDYMGKRSRPPLKRPLAWPLFCRNMCEIETGWPFFSILYFTPAGGDPNSTKLRQ